MNNNLLQSGIFYCTLHNISVMNNDLIQWAHFFRVLNLSVRPTSWQGGDAFNECRVLKGSWQSLRAGCIPSCISVQLLYMLTLLCKSYPGSVEIFLWRIWLWLCVWAVIFKFNHIFRFCQRFVQNNVIFILNSNYKMLWIDMSYVTTTKGEYIISVLSYSYLAINKWFFVSQNICIYL